MTVIAMGREMGSLGKKIAEGVARKLDLPVIHYEIIDHLSDRSRVRRLKRQSSRVPWRR